MLFAGMGNSNFSEARIIVTYEEILTEQEDLFGSFELIDPVSDLKVRDLVTTNNLSALEASAMNVKAVPPMNSKVKSIVFNYKGRIFTDNVAPYAMFQDTAGDYENGELYEGITNLIITYYSGSGGGGSLLSRDKIAFNVGVSNTGGSFYPTEDAYLNNGEKRNLYSVEVKKGISVGYLQFDLGNIVGKITGAELQFTIRESEGSGTTNIFLGTHSDWTDGNLNEKNKPNIGEYLAGYSQTQNIGDRKKVALKEEFIKDGKITLILIQKNGNGLTFPSSESTKPSNYPVLVIEVDGEDGRDKSGDISAIDDAYIINGKWNNNETILVQKDASLGYLKFDLSQISGEITEAELWFTIIESGGGSTNIFTGSHSDWTEDDTSATSAPTTTSNFLGNFSETQELGKIIKVDLQEPVINDYTGDLITLVLKQKSGEPYTIASFENKEFAIKPALILTVEDDFVVQPQSCTLTNYPYKSVSLSDENYILTRSYQKAMTTFSPSQQADVIESVTYFDGLGRPKQNIGISASGDRTDLVTPITYDAYGRQTREYLPYATGGTPGRLRSGATAAATNFYADTFDDTNPYAEKQFEASPLNRILKQGAPGKDWKLSSGDDHSIEFDYSANSASDNVRQYEVTTTLSGGVYQTTLNVSSTNAGRYGNNELYKTITRDENHSGATKNHTVEEFTDKQGRTILKRTYADTPGASQARHDTYYIYDDFGNLSFVLPPKMEGSSAAIATIRSTMDALGYRYIYDGRNRLAIKQVPGKGEQYIIYNTIDQPVMTQDANLRAKGEWLSTKYDAFGRVAYSGKTNDGRTRAQVQSAADTFSGTHWVARSGATYNNGGYPTTVSEVLTINYYDNYNFDRAGAPATTSLYNTPGSSTTKVRGLSTGSRVKVLDVAGEQWITTVTLYDEKARPVFVQSNNEYLSTVDVTQMEVDFAGRTQSSQTTHTRNGTTITTVDTYGYDHMGRLTAHTQKIDDGPEVAIACSTYDALGRMATKRIGGGLQNVDYAYNIRGWLTEYQPRPKRGR